MGTVRLIGAGPLGRDIAGMLAAGSVVSKLYLADRSPTDPTTYPDAPYAPTSAEALRDLLRANEPRPGSRRIQSVSHWSKPDGARVDLTVVVTGHVEPDRAITEHLIRDDLPHLVVRLDGRAARVGPLVVPGRTACLNCLDLVTTTDQPSWPDRLLAASRTTARHGDRLLASWTSSMAALQVHSYLRSGPTGRVVADTVGCTVELDLDDGLTRVRHWPLHPDCGCHWSLG
ncbi:hypothetical protein [Microlunatus sp. Y2014]|uniref:hypothetical protein n=1 Tax=Microlunatus sp. Y2014 TaxID=3418488 RepID=UPI003DA746F0